MKIFISHASANKEYGNALVDLLRGVGIKDDEIIYTSNTAYGIPTGQNIFKWLKSQITEKPFVIYLLSKEYYSSIACLNEMGAAWVIENEHASLFVPDFDLSSKEFQNGAIDPREIGFFLDNEERVISFIQHLETKFTITKNQVLLNQKIKTYLKEVKSIIEDIKSQLNEDREPKNTKNSFFDNSIIEEIQKEIPEKITVQKPTQSVAAKLPQNEIYEKFVKEITSGKLKDEELILIHYIIETSRTNLMTGWQEEHELKHIKDWQEVTELNNTLSTGYSAAIRKFQLRGYTEVSAVTSSNNPKEVKLKSEISSNILDLPEAVLEVINSALHKNKRREVENQDFGLNF